MLWDLGQWEGIGDVETDFRKGKLRFKLRGEKLRGGWTLVRMKTKAADGNKDWLLIKERDDQARKGGGPDIPDERPDSIGSGRSMDEIAADRRQWKDGRAIEGKIPRPKPEKALKSGEHRQKNRPGP